MYVCILGFSIYLSNYYFLMYKYGTMAMILIMIMIMIMILTMIIDNDNDNDNDQAFFRDRAVCAFLSAGVPLSKLCLVGGVQKIETALSAVDVECGIGAGAVQMGRAMLADPDYCIKNGIYTPNSDSNSDSSSSTSSNARCSGPLNVCDQSNRCIVGSTMALQPLQCVKYSCASTADTANITSIADW